MPLAIPLVASVPSYRFSTTLDSFGDGSEIVPQTYVIDVHWNARDEAWYMDLLASDETPIRHGLKIVLGALIGGRCVDERFPAGCFMAVDLSGEGREATLDDIGTRVVLYFYTAAELTGG